MTMVKRRLKQVVATGLDCSWITPVKPAARSAGIVLFRPAAALSFDLSFDIAGLAHCDATSESRIHPTATCKALILNGEIVQLAFLPDADASLAQEILEIADR